ncbi:MAG: DUF1015 domain-containing protein [Flavobacteriales bacterium]|nr:DUF1015 domain-containing protein [Flavobacteriales bacterium]MBK7269146.1 DUF1015 domain-containing protein [Flavobacteriales bacterium]MBK9074213.1 DUF1015 domain-containing protein [Flavobacteriales bacterium]
MIRLRPFRAWRPVPDKAHLVASRSYVSYSEEKMREKLIGNPYSFLHVIHPDHGKDEHLSRQQRFGNVRRKWNEFVGHGWYLRDSEPCIYLYEQSRQGLLSRGIVASVSVGDYRGGKVKVHEHTLQVREELFKEYLQTTGINAEPVLLAAPGAQPFDEALRSVWTTRPIYDFSTTDMVRHRVWAISDPVVIRAVEAEFKEIPALYIADGHHRLASSARLAESSGAFAEDPKAWCLAFIVPQEHLHIRNFDRAVTSLGGMDTDEFLEALSRVGRLYPLGEMPSDPPASGCVQVCSRKGWYTLELPRPGGDVSPSDRLDASVLSDAVLDPVLGIHDLRTDPHVKFVPGTLGPRELERMVKAGEAAAAFHLRPVSFAEMKGVADGGCCMPPKSTYIEPKLRSGLLIYSLEEA